TGLCISPGYNATVFEPIDAYKGDLARSYFYMMTRYYGGINSWSSPMLSGGDLAPWAVAVLLQWNDLDPVSPKETARNNAIFALQHNRNPFIDRPEWVHAIWGGTVGVQAQEAPALEVITDASGIEVERATSGPGTLLVRDASGRTVLRAPLSAAREHITFSSAKGVYIAEVTGSGSRMVKRFTW
ncbi:MAG: endonuclease, partial [Bacteroidetes bacterium]|nr:endonuclease [Bacteroidota bacterium]